jgi:hypothetical protein
MHCTQTSSIEIRILNQATAPGDIAHGVFAVSMRSNQNTQTCPAKNPIVFFITNVKI